MKVFNVRLVRADAGYALHKGMVIFADSREVAIERAKRDAGPTYAVESCREVTGGGIL